jgi:hypothetical protein
MRRSGRSLIAALIAEMGLRPVLSGDAVDAREKVENARFAAMIIEVNDDHGAAADLAAVLDGPGVLRGLPVLSAADGEATPVVIYSANEAPACLLEQVDLAMVKSKLPVMDLRDQIARLLDLGPEGPPHRKWHDDAA